MSAEFFQIGEDHRSKTSIRAWEPGDGLYCSHRTNRAKTPCTAPVAVKKTVLKSGGSKWNPEVRTYNICGLHLAQAMTGLGGPGITAEADKAAREAVLAAHWDEYQAELAKRVDEKRMEGLSRLPHAIQEAIRNAEPAEPESEEPPINSDPTPVQAARNIEGAAS